MEVSLVLDEAQEVMFAWQAVMVVDLAARLVAVVLMVAAALATPPGVVVESVVEESAQAAMEVAVSISLSPPGSTPNKELASSAATPEHLSSFAPPTNQHPLAVHPLSWKAGSPGFSIRSWWRPM